MSLRIMTGRALSYFIDMSAFALTLCRILSSYILTKYLYIIMQQTTQKLIWGQLETKLKHLKNFTMPSVGWVSTMRHALSMSGAQLAKRCQISKQRIAEIEKDERRKTVTLHTLEKIAAQLNCRLVYALVPNEPIESIIEKEARNQALKRLKLTHHTMLLEDQALDKKASRMQLELLTEELKAKPKLIWADNCKI